MRWPIVSLILIAETLACDNLLDIKGRQFKVCIQNQKVYSPQCKNPKRCFDFPQENFIYTPNQSPLFSLCYQSGGKPYFARLKEEKDKIEICLNQQDQVIDLNTLMSEYQKIIE